MRNKFLAPVAIAAAALALTACSPLDFMGGHAPVSSTTSPTSVIPDVLKVPAPTPTVPSAIAKVATPTTAPAPAPVETTAAPAPVQCEEDQPCWDCTTMGNKICGDAAPLDTITAPTAPVVAPVAAPAPVKVQTPAPAPAKPVQAQPAPATDSYSGLPVVDCAKLGKITAEDHSCVSPNYYAPTPAPVQTSAPAPAPATTPAPCTSLQLGDGGTTQQHNCTPAPGQTAPHPTSAPVPMTCIHTEELRVNGTTQPSMCF